MVSGVQPKTVIPVSHMTPALVRQCAMRKATECVFTKQVTSLDRLQLICGCRKVSLPMPLNDLLCEDDHCSSQKSIWTCPLVASIGCVSSMCVDEFSGTTLSWYFGNNSLSTPSPDTWCYSTSAIIVINDAIQLNPYFWC